jgi:plastocyanin
MSTCSHTYGLQAPANRADNASMLPAPVHPALGRAVPRLRALLPLLVALSLVASRAGAYAVHGVVHVPAPPKDGPAFEPYPGQANSIPHHPLSPRGVMGDAVVYLESVPASVDSALLMPARVKLAQKDQCFVPRVVALPLGGSVDFPNLDPIYHNVFSVSPLRRFDLGKYPKGESRTVRFAKAGLVNVYCDIHSDMAAFIFVLPNRVFARPRPDGTWELPDVPQGRYTLCWWHPDFAGGRQVIEIGPNGAAAPELSFSP